MDQRRAGLLGVSRGPGRGRKQVGRSLSEQERQMVWSRLWWILENIKREVAG